MTIAMAAINAEAKSVTIAGKRLAIKIPVKICTTSNHGDMLNVDCNPSSIAIMSADDVVEALSPAMVNTMMEISNEGIVVISIYLIWVKSGTSVVEEANTVVSLMTEILSPKYAPEIIAPAIQPSSKPNARPIPIRATPIVAMVVHEEPVRREIIAQMIHEAGKKIDGCRIFNP